MGSEIVIGASRDFRGHPGTRLPGHWHSLVSGERLCQVLLSAWEEEEAMDTAPSDHVPQPLAEHYYCTPVPNCKLSLEISWSDAFRELRKFTAVL